MLKIVLGIARAYPLIASVVSVLLYLLMGNGEYLYLFTLMLGGELINHGLKTKLFKPLMGNDKYPILGLGRRPDGAGNTGFFYVSKNNKSTSYGMPSGHAQSTALFSSFLILKLLDNKFISNLDYVLIGLLSLAPLYIMWSRVHLGVHTIQQTIIGSLTGALIGYGGYKLMD